MRRFSSFFLALAHFLRSLQIPSEGVRSSAPDLVLSARRTDEEFCRGALDGRQTPTAFRLDAAFPLQASIGRGRCQPAFVRRHARGGSHKPLPVYENSGIFSGLHLPA